MPKASPKKVVPKVRIEIYKTRNKQWRWRAVARNNKIIGTGGEAYKRKATMLKSLALIVNQLEYTPIREVEK